MSITFHRWLNRVGTRRVLAVLLGLVLVTAQTLALRHELSHGFGPRVDEDAATAYLSAPAVKGDLPAPLASGHECSLCLLAAALGGVAAGSQPLQLAAVSFEAPVLVLPPQPLRPRPFRAYATRAPPRAVTV